MKSSYRKLEIQKQAAGREFRVYQRKLEMIQSTAVTTANAAATVCLHLCTAKYQHRDKSATYTAATGDPSEAPPALRLPKVQDTNEKRYLASKKEK
ncbi:hypothetical protein E2C01_035102 [Portunus trituberculatus]|uniref:Uncharacterized protein n=1 Tax=Portunus trituberculatus TaxID=210409 RepID=A0A5B7F8F6_PORTR|nr:hypothetical protein [Portunus trituberculatus]